MKIKEPKEKKCAVCKTPFLQRMFAQKYCSPKCSSVAKAKRMEGKPKKKLDYKLVNKQNAGQRIYLKHKSELKTEQIKERGYTYCEECGNKSFVTAHHIMSRGRYPNHPLLHEKINLALLCLPCHTLMHSEQERNLKWVKSRKLIEKFNK